MPGLIDSTLEKKERIAVDTYEVTLKLDSPFDFKPGQYIWIILPKLAYPDPKGERRAFSITSNPIDKNRISVIFRDSLSGYKKTLLDLAIGTKLKIRGPQGQSFVLKGDEANVCLIGGGAGAAPFMGIIRSLGDFPSKTKLTFVNLNSGVERKFLTEEIGKIADKNNIRLIDHIGPFSVKLLGSLPDPRNTIYFVCGPQAMVDDVYENLRAWGIEESQMRFEQFYPSPKHALAGFPKIIERENVLKEENSELFRKRMVQKLYVYYYYTVFAIIGVILGVLFVQRRPFFEFLPLFATFGVMALNYLIFRVSKRLDLLLHLTLGLNTAIIGFVLWSGNIDGMAIYWLAFFPVLAFFSLGRKWGIAWTVIFTSMVVTILGLSLYRLTPYYYGFLPSVQSLMSLVYTSLIAFFVNRVTESFEDSMVKTASLRENYRLAVESASDHIVITDSNAKILYANKAAEKVTGYSLSEMLGNTPRLWGGQMGSEFYRQMWDLKKYKKEYFTGEVTNIRKNGEQYTAIVRISPILDKTGYVAGFVATEEDISDREKLEKDLEIKLDELARLNRFMVGRELKMRDLKAEITALKKGKDGRKTNN